MLTDAPRRGFPESEFATRTRKAQRLMAEQNLSGLLLTTEPEVRYFSGFHTQFWQSPTRPWFLFVPAQGKPVAIIPEIGSVLMRKTWLDDIRTWNAPVPEDDGISLLIDLFRPWPRETRGSGCRRDTKRPSECRWATGSGSLRHFRGLRLLIRPD